MKRMKRLIAAMLFVICTAVTVPTAQPAVQTAYAAKTVTISKKSVTLKVGQTTNLRVKNTSKKARWTTSNKRVVTVNQSGRIVAKKNGTATVTAKIGKRAYKCKVTVKASSNSKKKAVKSSPMVWITATGSKYHSVNNCGRTNPSKASQITESEAKSWGYDVCSKCY